ncbi:hypothetical protein VLK31_35440 [Variovorax sp. H27-G14]|uniref:hypothetical protein n=1 Tax=Variovorax sp. H27-G14 TaxID=3111914 RepID=UPI0038FCE34F
MTLNHAVALIDHHSAQILQFSATEVQDHKIKEHARYTRQHASEVRSEHEFFAEVSDALAAVRSVLVAGSHTAQADFCQYVEKHRPALPPRIVFWHTVDHPSAAELVKLGRRFCAERGDIPATPRLS